MRLGIKNKHTTVNIKISQKFSQKKSTKSSPNSKEPVMDVLRITIASQNHHHIKKEAKPSQNGRILSSAPLSSPLSNTTNPFSSSQTLFNPQNLESQQEQPSMLKRFFQFGKNK